ncbi:metallophosphoesterase [Polaribacter vadi]|uniref:metallophosphoesterase n=1 Tax=Polaribacter TaxID=52959 RepID=UPI001C088D86|nr:MULTISPECIES: metallophosphoesterase [Polaribacter]MBU3012772.1 metallophosphoesterase [Polaribacter vadi]MDO6742588.1 metallophosphoesterase [Polaribacter sp. 1_MG-2023]
MNRKAFLKKSMYSVLGLGLFTAFYSWQLEPFWLEFVKLKMPIKNLPENLVGKKLMQISDIHVGNRFDYNYLIDSFKKAQKLNPDFVVYTGDFIDYESEEQFTQLSTVLKHVVTGKFGTVGVLGNHDYGKEWSQEEVAQNVISILKEHKIEVLRNSKTSYQGLNFIGIDDYWSFNFKPKEATKNLDINKPYVALCHNPDVCDLDVWNGYNSWILSGHTHGGQVKPPFLPPPILPVENERYSAGKIDLEDGRTLYINRALGCLRQVRFNVRPEITIFELEQA